MERWIEFKGGGGCGAQGWEGTASAVSENLVVGGREWSPDNIGVFVGWERCFFMKNESCQVWRLLCSWEEVGYLPDPLHATIQH